MHPNGKVPSANWRNKDLKSPEAIWKNLGKREPLCFIVVGVRRHAPQGLFKLTGQQSCSQIVPKMPVVIQSCWSISYVYLLSYQGRYTFCTSNIWSPQKRRSGKSQDALSSAVGSGLEYGPEPVEKWQAVDRWEIDRPPGEIAMSLVNFNNRLVQPGCCLTYWQRAAKRMKGAGGMCFLFWPVLLWCFISIDVFL